MRFLVLFLFFAIVQHDILDPSDGLSRVESLGTRLGAVHDGVASVERVIPLHLFHAVEQRLVTRIDHPTVHLHQHRGTQISIAIPPVTGAAGRAASAENALVQSIQFGTIFHRLKMSLFAEDLFAVALEIRLDARVLLIKVGHIWHEIFDDVHVRQGIDFRGFGWIVDRAKTRQSVAAVDVHRTRTANAFATRASEGETGVEIILDVDQRVQNHRPTLVQIHFENFFARFFSWVLRIKSVNLELFHARG